MENTHFENATGLDAEGHLSTARDIAIMSRALLAHPKIKDYSTVWMDTLRDGQTQLVNTNKLVRFYEGCTGLKTGTTDAAGSCLAASAQRDGLELVVMMSAGAVPYAFSGCIIGCAAGLPLSRLLYDKLITSHFPYHTWSLPVPALCIILLFVLGAMVASVYAPSKRMRRMAITETINEL